ncbi:MAG: hypothetical protein AB9897_09255 [Anaerolineaceae bacterium]
MQTSPQSSTPIGFHFYPDSAHYTNKDLNDVLTHLKALNASWLVMRSESSRAIPETFISGLIANQITPIIHFSFSLPNAPVAADIKSILNAYSNWGVKYVILFDQPNDRSSWSASGWSQTNLVESFLDRFIPLANECLTAGLVPVFPALTPGGSYWDLSFFSLALQAMQRRGQKTLLAKMALAAYGCTYEKPLDWGQGGASSWPQNRPYLTPGENQDQIGFNQSIWLEEIAAKILGNPLPLILLGLGRKQAATPSAYSPEEHTNIVRQIKAFLTSTIQTNSTKLPLLAGNFWLLNAPSTNDNYPFAWVREDGATLPAYQLLSSVDQPTNLPQPTIPQNQKKSKTTPDSAHPIQHYLLLPKYEWGISDWHLEVIKPFIIKHQPTIGFSIEEAKLAELVTVVGGEQSFSEETLALLRDAGCQVDRISGDGTSIATQLAER